MSCLVVVVSVECQFNLSPDCDCVASIKASPDLMGGLLWDSTLTVLTGNK